MNAFKTTPLATLVAVLALAGCDQRDDAAVTPAPGTTGGTASAPGMTGDSGSMSPGGTATKPSTTPAPADASPPPASPGASAPPAGSTSMAPTGGGALTPAEETFVVKAASDGLYEVEVSQMAADKAKAEPVKGFASMLVDHHSAANAELKALAESRNVKLPDEVPDDKQAKIDKLEKAPDAQFDQQYVKTVGIEDHKTDIALFEKASKEVKDPELKAWIDKTLPTLREHLAAAQKLPGAKVAAKS